MPTKEELLERVRFCRKYRRICYYCEYHNVGRCYDIYDLLKQVQMILEVDIYGVEDN